MFLDRDGVLTRPLIRQGKAYAPTRLADFEILPEAEMACSCLKRAGFLLVVVTNQPDVGRGLIPSEVMDKMNRLLQHALPLDEIIFCTDPSESPGPRRKPAPGMLIEAAGKWDIDFGISFMIGDRKGDIEAGDAVGCQGIFIDRNYKEPKPKNPAFVCYNIWEAASWILKNPCTRSS